MPRASNQSDIVLEHMLQYGSISSIEATELYKITRLGAVIHRLRHKDKININMQRVSNDEAGGSGGREGSSYGLYTLVPATIPTPATGV